MISSSNLLQLIAAKAQLVKKSSSKSSHIRKYYICIRLQPHIQRPVLKCLVSGVFTGKNNNL